MNKSNNESDDILDEILNYADKVKSSSDLTSELPINEKSNSFDKIDEINDVYSFGKFDKFNDEKNIILQEHYTGLSADDDFEEQTTKKIPDGLKKAVAYISILAVTFVVAYVSYAFKLPQLYDSYNGLPVNNNTSLYEEVSNFITLNDLLTSIEETSQEIIQSEELSFEETTEILTSSFNQLTSNQTNNKPNKDTVNPPQNNDGEVEPPTNIIPDDNNAPQVSDDKTDDITNNTGETVTTTPPENEDLVSVTVGGKVVTMTAFDAVCGWVSTEINYNYPKEAIKAQAVAAYTYIKYYNASNSSPYIYVASPHDNVKNAVKEVLGEKIYNGNRIAFTPWFAMSAGITLNSEQVWGGVVSNLKSVDSSIEKGYTDGYSSFKSTVTYSASAIKNKIENTYSISLSNNKSNWFSIKGYHQVTEFEGKTIGYVSDCLIDGQKNVTGRVVRENLLNGLESKRFRSSAFDEPVYNSDNDTFTFTVYGYGHGCGMSQIGAKLYAQNGWSYKDILTHYYKGVAIK